MEGACAECCKIPLLLPICMGTIKTKALHNTIISYAGAVIGYVNFLILLPYAFSPEEIGLTRVLQNAAALFVPLAQLGIVTAVVRYFPYFKSDEAKRYSFFLYTIIIAFLGFILFTFSFWIFKGQIISFYIKESPLLIEYYFLIIPLTFFLVFFGVLEAFANSHYKTAVPIFLRDIVLRLFTTVLALLYVFAVIDFNQFIWLLIGSYGVGMICLMYYLRSIGELRISFDFTFLKNGFYKEILNYGFYMLLGATGASLVSYIDILMIGSMIGLKETGIYAIAFYMAVVIDIPRRGIKQIVDPFIATATKNDDKAQIADLYKKLSINQLIIGILFILGIWGNINEIFTLVPNGDIYATGKYVVLIIMLGKLVDMGSSMNGEIIGYSKYYKFNILSVILLAILTVLTNLIFIPIYGINGAAFATFFSLLLFNILKFLFILIKLKIQPFDINTIKILAIGCICYGAVLLLPDVENVFINILINSTTIVVLYVLAVYISNVSQDVNQGILKVFNSVLRR